MNYTGVVFPRIKAVFQLGVEWHDWREFRNSQSNDGSDNVCYLDTYVFSLRYGKHRYFKNRGSHLTTRSAFDKEIGNGSCIPAVRSIIPVVNCVRCKETIDISTSKDLLCPSCYQKVQEFIEQEENEFTKTGNLPMKLNFKCKHCGAKERTRSFTFGFCKPCYWSLCELESIAKKDLKGYERYKKNMLAIKKARTNKEKIYWRPA